MKKEMAKILSFNLQEEKRLAVMLLTFRLGIQYVAVDPDRQGETLEQLCGISVRSAENNGNSGLFTDEMLVFYNLSSQDLNEFLDLLRRNGHSVSHKAVVTETNKTWTAYKLFHEIDREYHRIENMKNKNKRKK